MLGRFLAQWGLFVYLSVFLAPQTEAGEQPVASTDSAKTGESEASFLTDDKDFKELPSDESAQVLAGVENEFNHMTTFKGPFIQNVRFTDGQKALYSGNIYWKPPQMVIDLPNSDQRIVVDGQWMSSLDLKKHKRSTNHLPGYLSLLFKGHIRLREQFPNAKVYWDPHLKLTAVALQPQKSSYRFYLYCSRFKKNGNIKNIVGWYIIDNKGVRTLLFCLEGAIRKRIKFDDKTLKLFSVNNFNVY